MTDQTLEYAHDGVRLLALRLQTNFAGVASTYQLTTAERPIVVRTGAAPGDSAQAVLRGDGVTITTAVRVDRRETIPVGGNKVDCLVVVFDSTISGELEGTQRAVTWLATDLSLPVKEEVAADVTSRGVRIQSRYAATTQSSRPR